MEPVRFVLTVGRSYELTVVNLGLACCAVEFVAAAMSDSSLVRRLAGPAGRTSVLVVAGTVTDKAVPAVRTLYDALPEPKAVLSFGACANTGGPYWDSYSVTKGVDQVLPVDAYVAGCPPRPEALLQGLLQLQDRLPA
ncbi:MAG: NADH-quinone oxidoreductase subunit B [Mycobacteriales bacterium]